MASLRGRPLRPAAPKPQRRGTCLPALSSPRRRVLPGPRGSRGQELWGFAARGAQPNWLVWQLQLGFALPAWLQRLGHGRWGSRGASRTAPDWTRRFTHSPPGSWLMSLMEIETEKVSGTFPSGAEPESEITQTFPRETQTQLGTGVWALDGHSCFRFTPHCTYWSSLPAFQLVHGGP